MNISGKYLKVWKKTVGENYVKLDLGEGEKKYQSEEYENWTFFGCFLVGNAKNVDILEGDKVEIKSGKIKMQKYNDKWSPSITIFEIEVMQSGNTGNAPEKLDTFDDGKIPF